MSDYLDTGGFSPETKSRINKGCLSTMDTSRGLDQENDDHSPEQERGGGSAGSGGQKEWTSDDKSPSSGSLQPPGPRRPLRDESSPGLELGSPLGTLVGHFQGSGHSHSSPPLLPPRSRHAPRWAEGPSRAPPTAPGGCRPRLRSALRPLAPAARARRARLPRLAARCGLGPAGAARSAGPSFARAPRPREEGRGG